MAKNLKQLLSQIEKLQSQADALKMKERLQVIGRIQEAIDHYGLTADELFGKPGGKAKIVTAKRASAAKRAKKVVKSAGQPKYQDGTGRTWTGRGKRPAWFVEALDAGKTAESMLIERAET